MKHGLASLLALASAAWLGALLVSLVVFLIARARLHNRLATSFRLGAGLQETRGKRQAEAKPAGAVEANCG